MGAMKDIYTGQLHLGARVQPVQVGAVGFSPPGWTRDEGAGYHTFLYREGQNWFKGVVIIRHGELTDGYCFCSQEQPCKHMLWAAQQARR